MVGVTAHSCSMVRLVVREALQASENCTSMSNLKFQHVSCGFQRRGIISLATRNRVENVSRSRRSGDATRLPVVRRWEAEGLQAPLFPKAEVFRPIRRDNSSKVVVCSLPLQAASSVQMASAIFTLGNAFVLPFYSVMVLAPKWKWTKRIVESDLPFILMGVMYIYLLTISWTPQTAGLMFASKYYLPEASQLFLLVCICRLIRWLKLRKSFKIFDVCVSLFRYLGYVRVCLLACSLANLLVWIDMRKQLPGITHLFSNTVTVASAWIHLLIADLFCGRYVFLDGLQHKVETRHSLVLCLMMCPTGIISHLITKVITSFTRRTDGERSTEMAKALI